MRINRTNPHRKDSLRTPGETPHRLDHAGATTPTLRLEISGVRYVRHPDDAMLLGGNQVKPTTMRFIWQLRLVRDADVVWQLADARDVAPHLHWLP